jgi:hypothetical protein
MKTLATYWRLLVAQAASEMRLSEAHQLAGFVKYGVIGLLCVRGLWLAMTPSVVSAVPAWARLIHGGYFLALTTSIATLTAAMGMLLFPRFPELPYQRFWSPWVWHLRSWFLPMVSLNSVWLALLFLGLLGPAGLGYFLAFYGAHLLAQRALPAAIGLSVGAAFVAYGGATEAGVAALVLAGLVCAALWLWRVSRTGAGHEWSRPSAVWRTLTISLRKELAYIRTFTSDTVHLVLALLVWGFVSQVLVRRPDLLAESFGLPLMCLLAVLPFCRALQNLMGMDPLALRRMVYDPSALVRYQLTRTRGYALVIYGLDSVVAVELMAVGNAAIVPRLILTALACTELALLGGFFTSVYLFEEKEVSYRYGQHLHSRNIHVSLAILFAIGGLVHLLYLVSGITAVAILAAGYLYLNRHWIQTAGVVVVERRRDSLIRAVR